MKKTLLSLIAAVSLLGCQAKEGLNYDVAKGNYFGQIPTMYQNGVASSAEDFDNDGDIDLIVTVINEEGDGRIGARSYFYENDGKGNFRIRPPQEYQSPQEYQTRAEKE